MVYRMLFYVVFCVLLVVEGCGSGKTPDSVRKPAERIDKILAPGMKLERVTTGYNFDTAGSPLYMDGELYFTNNNFDEPEKSCVIKMEDSGTYHVLRPDNGVTTTMRPGSDGNIYCCEMLGHRVIEMDRYGSVISVVCDKYNGTRIDGPNDLVVDRDGGIYFTDSQFIAGRPKMQETPAVYYITQDGDVIRVIDDVDFPNGVALSPDGKTLYVANTLKKHVRFYDVLPDGKVSNGRNFAELELPQELIDTGNEESGADGMAVDSEGNLFVATTKGIGIQVFDSSGARLGSIPCPSVTNNCSFGGEDLKTLFVSAKDGIYKIPVQIAGIKIQ